MGEGAKRSFRDSFSKPVVSAAKAVEQDPWLGMEVEDDVCDSGSDISSFEEDSAASSFTSSSCSDLTEDASSSPPELSNGPLFELSDLMAHLPIKRGLSKFYQGKAQSFTCLSSVSCLEDLAKRVTPCRKRMKPSCSPKAIISKKTSRGSAPTLGRRSSLRGSFKPPIPVQTNDCKANQ